MSSVAKPVVGHNDALLATLPAPLERTTVHDPVQYKQ
jgi:hypothetical protein